MTDNIINLQEYINSLSYKKTETWTQTEITAEILDEISKLTLVEVVAELPANNIKKNRLYLRLNDKAETENLYDIYVYANNKWEKIDSLELNIDDYYTKSDIDIELNKKSDTNHTHNNATTTTNGFLSTTDKIKLDGISEGANKTIIDTSLSTTSTNPVQNKVINNALSGKLASSHANTQASTTVLGHAKPGTTNPVMDGTASPGTDNGLYARADHVHPTDTSRASNTIATTSLPGLMSANDKQKLDGIDLSQYTTVEEVQALIVSGGVTVDSNLSTTSSNPVQNKVITNALNNKLNSDDLLTSLNNIITQMNNL